MYRRGLSDDSARRRLLDTAIQLDRIMTSPGWGTSIDKRTMRVLGLGPLGVRGKMS